MMRSEDGEVCTTCRVVVDSLTGTATATYQWAGNHSEGRDTHDEDVSEWKDDEIRDVFAELIGIVEGREQIEVVWN